MPARRGAALRNPRITGGLPAPPFTLGRGTGALPPYPGSRSARAGCHRLIPAVSFPGWPIRRHGDGTPLAGAVCSDPVKVVIAPVGVSSVTRTDPSWTRPPFCMTAM